MSFQLSNFAAGLEDLLQLGDGQAVAPRILRIDHDRDAVVGDRDLDELDADFLGFGELGGLDAAQASEMSVRSSGFASRNFLKPPPVPEMPTVTCTFGCTSLNISAVAAVIG